MSITKEELERHTENLWGLFLAYVIDNHLENETTGILLVGQHMPASPDQANWTVRFAGPQHLAARRLGIMAMAVAKDATKGHG